MEKWQISCITSNLDQLIQNTICDTTLIAYLIKSEILSNSDKQAIEAEKECYGKAAKLYDMLQTRKNGFSSLARGLRYYNQTGALEILQSSFLQQDATKILSTSYAFCNWKNLLSKIPDSLIQRTVHIFKEDYIETFLFKETQTEFNPKIIPNCPPYYVPRSISNRLRLDPKIFQVDCPDVFVFKDIERHKLSKLVNPMGTESSCRQMDEVTCKFIHLNAQSDFIVICQNRNDKPVHLVKYETLNHHQDTQETDSEPDEDETGSEFDEDESEGESDETEDESFILEESYGNSEVLRDFIHKNLNHNRCYVSEDEFVQNIDLDDMALTKSFCICDSPGSGKTWLLASLAQQIKSKYSDRIIVFQKFSEIEFSHDSVNDAIGYLVSKVCPNPMVKNIITTAIHVGSIKMDVFLDALDEVDFEQVQTAKQFMTFLKNASANIRLFVSSRPHMRYELESTLGVVAYDIRPFDKENQLDFLEQCWCTLFSCSIDVSRLKDFAKACQKKVQSSLSPQERDIMGIPLQCYMLAEIYLYKAKMYCKSSKTTLNQFLESPVSLFEMYKHFITLNLQKLMSQLNDDGKRTKCFHTWKALEIFSPKLAVLYKQVFFSDDRLSGLEYLSSGILQSISNIDNRLQISFVHQTFAEYLVAEFICNILSGLENSHGDFCNLKNGLIEFVATNIFHLDSTYCSYSFLMKYPPLFNASSPVSVPRVSFFKLRSTTIPFFLNEHLRFACSKDLQNVTSEYFLEVFKPNYLFNILLNCVRLEWIYLIQLFKEHLQLAKEKPDIILWYKSMFLAQQDLSERPVFLLCYAAKYSNLSIFKLCVQFYEKCFDYNIIDAVKRIPMWWKTPFHEAVERGDYEMVEYFVQLELPFGNGWLLHQCVGNSNTEDVTRVDAKIQILSLLLNENEHLIWDMEHANKHGPLVKSLLAAPGINLTIIEFLVRKYKEILQTGFSSVLPYLDFKVIKNASRSMNKKDFHELCRIFFEDFNIIRTAKTKQQLVDTIKIMLGQPKLEPETMQMVLEQFNSAELSDLSSTLLYQSTVGKQSAEIIELLVKKGVNLYVTDKKGFSIVHYAAEFGNKMIFKYLLTKGFSLNQQTMTGITPLMVSTKNYPEIILFLLKNGATIGLKDQDGETFLHKLAWKLQTENLIFGLDTFDELVKFLLNEPEVMKVLKSKSWKQMWSESRKYSFHLCGNLQEFCKKSTLMLLHKTLRLDFSSCDIGYARNNVLLEAIEQQISLELIKGLFECGASINTTNQLGENALHLAVKFGSWQTVAYILNKSSLPVNEKDGKSNTPLQLADNRNVWKITKLLFEHGADPFSLNKLETPYAHCAAHWTLEAEFCELVSLLQKHTNDPDVLNRKQRNGRTLLHVRLQPSYNKDKRQLGNFTLNQIKHNPKIDVNLADSFGDTLFLLLGQKGEHWDVVRALAENKACVISKNSEGYSLLHFAAAHGNLEMVKYFHSLGLPLEDKTVYGDTPILLAYKHLPVIKFLYGMGCDINAVNQNGQTILHKAATIAVDSRTIASSIDRIVDLVLFLKNRKVIQPFVKMDLKFGRSALHEQLYVSIGLPGYLVVWIVNLPTYNITAEDIRGNTVFQTAFENWPCLGACGMDAIYKKFCNSVEPEALQCALLKAYTTSVDRRNSGAVRYLLKNDANPNPRNIDRPMPIDIVVKKLGLLYNREEHGNQYNLILKEFLTYMLGDQSVLCAKDVYGNTFLHEAAKWSHPDDFQIIVTQICTCGFNEIFLMKNNKGDSPINIAIKNIQMSEETIRILNQNGVQTYSLIYSSFALAYRVISTIRFIYQLNCGYLQNNLQVLIRMFRRIYKHKILNKRF